MNNTTRTSHTERPKAFRWVCLSALLSGFLLVAGPASAEPAFDMSVSAMLGVGGAVGEDDVGFGNSTYQLGFAWVIESDILLGVRVGQVDFDAEDRVGDLSDFSLTYVNVVGEYRFSESYYTSGVYLGLGAYEVGAERDFLGSADETSLGIALGLTGEFDVSPAWAVRLEVAGHVVPSTEVSTFATAHVGVAYRF